MRDWLLQELSSHGVASADSEIESGLRELRQHSLPMVSFLASYCRVYDKKPDILAFIDNPTIQTLESFPNDSN
jgi:hypothetical protein